MKKHSQDDAIDELLKEHARENSSEEAFMSELEGKLDDSEQRTGATRRSRIYWWIPLSAVAAICLFWSARIWWEPADPKPAQNVANSELRFKKSPSPTNRSVGFTDNIQMAPTAGGTGREILTASNGSHPPFTPHGLNGLYLNSNGVSPPYEDSFALVTGFENDFRTEWERTPPGAPAPSGDRHTRTVENKFLDPALDENKFSTFAVDVDTASYSYLRSLIRAGQHVPADAVRLEEIANYFDYEYAQPDGEHPFAIDIDSASCPWQENHRLVRIGLQGKDIVRTERPAANLVFLLDVSGSMKRSEKLPLLKKSMMIMLEELDENDTVSIVVYASASGLVLPPTQVSSDGRRKIVKALDALEAGGSTAGGEGIKLAYKLAKENYVEGGVNRVILGTDGDFNVGISDTTELTEMVKGKAKSGTYLTVLGFGRGNLNDAMMESITNSGNGNYFYIDTIKEGRKVLLEDLMGTMVTIAKDVKVQLAFNPNKVKAYRLLGYANRMLKAEDFRNKRIDAGEIGAGHTVTALYEVIPADGTPFAPPVDATPFEKKKKAETKKPKAEFRDLDELLFVKLAYKGPEATTETESTYFQTSAKDSEKTWNDASDDFKFAAAAGLFSMVLRNSPHKSDGDLNLVKRLAEEGLGPDGKGQRQEFSKLLEKVQLPENTDRIEDPSGNALPQDF